MLAIMWSSAAIFAFLGVCYMMRLHCRHRPNLSGDASIGTHEVFISHRGSNIKNGFATHLKRSLNQRGITAFLDRESLPKGSDARPFIREAVARATIHVPVFTKNYAESVWCLDELVVMMNSFKTVFPVFYEVKPEDLRNMEAGPFAKFINDHRRKPEHNEDTIQEWVHALYAASWIVGFEMETYGGVEATLIEELVNVIEKEMYDENTEEDPRYTGGLQRRVEDVLDLLHLQEEEHVYFVLLWGMNGIGKTTLARAVHKRCRRQFKATSIVERCGDKNSSVILSNLLYDLCPEKDGMNSSWEFQERRLKRILKGKKVLVILDDIKDDFQFKDVLDSISPLNLRKGSRILVTSRDRSVGPHKEDFSNVFRGEFYRVQAMDREESMELFCRRAFKERFPPPGYEEQAKEVSGRCGGIPFVLDFLGCEFSKRRELLEEALDPIDYKEIKNKLMTSYDALSEKEQEMFLDVACFFIDQCKQSAEYFWEYGNSVVKWRIRLAQLVEKGLVEVDEDKGLVKMHVLLKDLGRHIVQEFIRSGTCSRLYDDATLLSKVFGSRQGLDQICGLAISSFDLKADLLSEMLSLRLLFRDDKGLVFHDKQEPSLEPLTVDSWTSGLDNLPFSQSQLKRLRMMWCQGLSELPSDFGDFKSLEALGISNFIGTNNLESSLVQLKNLRKLHLNRCNLEELPIVHLQSLEKLDLFHLERITKLPSFFFQLKNLRKLHLNRCNLEELPEDFGLLQSLEELDLFYLESITKLPSSFFQLKNLRKLNLNTCTQLSELPKQFGSLKRLEYLYLCVCSQLQELPEDFGSLENLEELHMRRCPRITNFPSSFRQLTKLRMLEIHECPDCLRKLALTCTQLKT